MPDKTRLSEQVIFREWFREWHTNSSINEKLTGKRRNENNITSRRKRFWILKGWLQRESKKIVLNIKRSRNSKNQEFEQKARDYRYRATVKRFFDENKNEFSDETRKAVSDLFESQELRDSFSRRKGIILDNFCNEIEENIIMAYILERLAYIPSRLERFEAIVDNKLPNYNLTILKIQVKPKIIAELSKKILSPQRIEFLTVFLENSIKSMTRNFTDENFKKYSNENRLVAAYLLEKEIRQLLELYKLLNHKGIKRLIEEFNAQEGEFLTKLLGMDRMIPDVKKQDIYRSNNLTNPDNKFMEK